MKQCFKDKSFKRAKTLLINKANEIIARYQASGYKLTLRQLYYQFVSADLIPNKEQSYKALGTAISEARLAGLIDWDAIEDRVRRPRLPLEFDDVESLVENAVGWYRRRRWKGQLNYVELWVEKDALAGVLQPIAQEYHITLMVNRGYSSQSAMYEAGMRFHRKGKEHENCYLFYLGDHDPSGEDMVRDVDDRLQMFGANVEVRKLALNMDQVKKYNPPPNPAKMSDSRAAKYVVEHGQHSWEVDALPPDVLVKLIKKELEIVTDWSLIDEVVAQEDKDKAALQKAARRINT